MCGRGHHPSLMLMVSIAVVVATSVGATATKPICIFPLDNYTPTPAPSRSREGVSNLSPNQALLQNSLLRIRGGGNDYLDGLSDDDDVSAEDLLDSLFDIKDDSRLKTQPAKSVKEASRFSGNSFAAGDGDDIKGKKINALWGPNAERHKKRTPGPPPQGATSDERRVYEHHRQKYLKRKKLLSTLALSLHDSHVSVLQSLIKGNAAMVPPELFGETILQEKSACNEMFHDVLEGEKNRREMRFQVEMMESPRALVLGDQRDQGAVSSISDDLALAIEPSFRHIEDPALLSYWGLTPNAKLYGGAQYHRVIRYYHHLFLTVPLPPITSDEVALLTNGINEIHDASDFLRAVSLLVQQKMEVVMEDVLADMTRRLLYVMNRQWEMVDYSMSLHRPMGGGGKPSSYDGTSAVMKDAYTSVKEAELFKKYGPEYTAAETDLKNVLSVAYHKFAELKAAEAHEKSLEDVKSLLRYISWDVGQARSRKSQVRNGNSSAPRIEIVSGNDSPTPRSHQRKEMASDAQKAIPSKKKRREYKNHGRQQLRTKGGGMHEDIDEEGDLIGGVLNRGKLDDADRNGKTSPPTSTGESSSIFIRDDQVLNILLDTVVSSTLSLKSDIDGLANGQQHTRAAIESLVSFVTDRMRMDISRIIRSKFNTFFLLAFYEELGPFLRREVDEFLASQSLE